jgi:radical SAM protein with 4Fe4S-binding SPASM domain
MSLKDCFDSFLYFRDRGHAEHFFWHWDEAEGEIKDLRDYLKTYGRDLHEIMETYVECLGQGDLLSILHINELILYLLTQKRRGSTACAVEKMANFDIIGDGRVHACADLPQTMNIGTISDNGEVMFKSGAVDSLKKIVSYKEEFGCHRCGVEPYCGGRCPVQACTGGIERAKQYCFMMREHVSIVKQYMAAVTDAMIKQGWTFADFHASARLAKFTDVTP